MLMKKQRNDHHCLCTKVYSILQGLIRITLPKCSKHVGEFVSPIWNVHLHGTEMCVVGRQREI